MKNKKRLTEFSYLTFYRECMKTGVLPNTGLCFCIPSYDGSFLDLMSPLRDEWSFFYWGSGLSVDDGYQKRAYEFTELRQTIVLFCAAMNNEL